MKPTTWFDLPPDQGVVEQDTLTVPDLALKLHVAVDPATGEHLAWWCTELGQSLGFAEMGSA
jgi:hypothetical protein